MGVLSLVGVLSLIEYQVYGSTEWDGSTEYEEVLRKTESLDYYRQTSTHHRFAE